MVADIFSRLKQIRTNGISFLNVLRLSGYKKLGVLVIEGRLRKTRLLRFIPFF